MPYAILAIIVDGSVWNPSYCENRKNLTGIMDDSTIICEEIIDPGTKSNNEETVPPNFNEKKATLKHKIYIFYLHFY